MRLPLLVPPCLRLVIQPSIHGPGITFAAKTPPNHNTYDTSLKVDSDPRTDSRKTTMANPLWIPDSAVFPAVGLFRAPCLRNPGSGGVLPSQPRLCRMHSCCNLPPNVFVAGPAPAWFRQGAHPSESHSFSRVSPVSPLRFRALRAAAARRGERLKQPVPCTEQARIHLPACGSRQCRNCSASSSAYPWTRQTPSRS